ncbi:MAG: ABC transporter substrate-binding protein [Symploca sp. SIO2D2]|nr:ABC transporter substrate-binding protein [Symploca sp. SIO2D2]
MALAAIARDKRLEKLAIIHLNDAYGQGLAASVQSAFEARGGKITGAVPFEPKQTSFEQELAQLAPGKADALVLIGFPDEGSKIIEQALKTRKFQQFILTDSLKSPQVVQAAGDRGTNISFGTAPQAFTGTKTYIAFQDSYETKFGELPEVPYTDMAYDATMILALAIAKAGSTEGAAIRDAIREVANSPGVDVRPGEWKKAIAAIENGEDIDYVGASGACEFDEQGDVAGTFGHWVVKNGEFVTVEAMLVK